MTTPDTPQLAFQEYYPEHQSRCYGCGRLNEHGLRIMTYWDGDETLTRFTPQPFHTAVPGIVYGGLLASLIDCHSTGSAAAAIYRAEGRSMRSDPPVRCVTGSLNVRYLKPTPLGPEIEIRGVVTEVKGRKVIITSTLSVDGVACVTGEVVALRLTDEFVL